MYEKFKSLIADDAFFTSFLLLLVGVVSFGLGRHSVESVHENQGLNQSTGVVFIESKESVNQAADSLDKKVDFNETRVVVSKSGTKYHLLTCSSAGRIKEENKVYFDSIDKAKAAGYEPAANCVGLR